MALLSAQTRIFSNAIAHHFWISQPGGGKIRTIAFVAVSKLLTQKYDHRFIRFLDNRNRHPLSGSKT